MIKCKTCGHEKEEKTRIESYETTPEINWKLSIIPLIVWIGFMILFIFLFQSIIIITTNIEDDIIRTFATISSLLLLLKLNPFIFPNLIHKERLIGVKYE